MRDRVYGEGPYGVVVLHGGPGAQGSMGYAAQRLGEKHGVLEPMQRALTVSGQVEELHRSVCEHTIGAVTMIGWSWGAWLGWWYAVEHPERVKRLILVSSGPFEAQYARGMDETRFSRLSEAERAEVKGLMARFNDPTVKDKTAMFARFGELFGKADSFDAIEVDEPPTEVNMDIFNAVWPEGAAMRKDGRLLTCAERIECPVVAIHGDYDPHPWQGVKEPLEQRVEDFTFHTLKDCGHEPWRERAAQVKFFEILENYLTVKGN